MTPSGIADQEWVRWAIALILGFPLSILVFNELIVWLRQREKPLVETFRIIRNLLVPAIALLLFLTKVLELGEANSLIRLMNTLVWILVIHASLSAFKVVLFEEAAAESWQSKVPGLLLDLVRFFLVACTAAVVLSSVWKVDLGGLLAALGVGSLVIGLALQDTLKNLFSGILLLFERPFALGDWLQVGDISGKVIQVNWRSVYLQTRSRSLVVIPNLTLAQGNFSNYSRPTALHVETVTFSFSYDDPPNKAMGVLKETALATEGILSEPEPWVRVAGYGDFAINYEIGIFLDGYEGMLAVRNEFVTRVWYAAKRHHLTIPYPIQMEYQVDVADLPKTDPAAQVAEVIRSLPNCASLAHQAIEGGEAATHLRYYARGERIFREGDRLAGLYLILKGKVGIFVEDRAGKQREIACVSRGEFFGEKALLAREASDVSAIAVEDVEVAVLDSDVVGNLLEKMPRLGREFSELMRMRRKAAATAKTLEDNGAMPN